MPSFNGIPVKLADEYRAGAPDAYGNPPEKLTSDGTAPCRCCLRFIAKGAEMLVLAYRPFATLQPYAETGPVFLCATPCQPDPPTEAPQILTSSHYLLKGYSAEERIVYGTGQITAVDAVTSYADKLLARQDIAFVDLRSALNNCWQMRITAELRPTPAPR